MKKIKTQRGITLIALIITIVVLLILAGVAIGTLQESNIIGRAKDAASSYEDKKGEEEEILVNYEDIMESYSNQKFNWKKIGLNIEVNTEYIYAAQNYIINFTEYGKIVVKQNGKIVDNIDATDSKNIDNEKLKFPFIIDGKSYNTTISMNENEIDVDAYIEGLGTVTYIKKTSSEVNSYTFSLSDIMQKGNKQVDITRVLTTEEFWPENVSENLKNNAFDTKGYLDEFETVFASNFTCSDSKFVNPFAIGGSQYWNEDTCCYLLFHEEEGKIFLIVQIDGHTVTESNYIELGLENLEFTISLPLE